MNSIKNKNVYMTSIMLFVPHCVGSRWDLVKPTIHASMCASETIWWEGYFMDNTIWYRQLENENDPLFPNIALVFVQIPMASWDITVLLTHVQYFHFKLLTHNNILISMYINKIVPIIFNPTRKSPYEPQLDWNIILLIFMLFFKMAVTPKCHPDIWTHMHYLNVHVLWIIFVIYILVYINLYCYLYFPLCLITISGVLMELI